MEGDDDADQAAQLDLHVVAEQCESDGRALDDDRAQEQVIACDSAGPVPTPAGLPGRNRYDRTDE